MLVALVQSRWVPLQVENAGPSPSRRFGFHSILALSQRLTRIFRRSLRTSDTVNLGQCPSGLAVWWDSLWPHVHMVLVSGHRLLEWVLANVPETFLRMHCHHYRHIKGRVILLWFSSTTMSHHIHRSALTLPEFVDRQQSEPLDISSALDVEQLDTNLFRSRSLYLPYNARGVFGGQVISQGLVAATRSVKSEFALHVSFVLFKFCPPHSIKAERAEPRSRCMYVVSACPFFSTRQHS